ncbi:MULTISPECIES: carbon starvation protein A [Shewanella]|jgi:carbon starvation protein CstA|uniref:Carbon starvation protein A n=1 Tax=Shewanella chilikensis TaxID=558541 RepID=A0A6G7LUC7_9GAMM|nr:MULTISPECIES: carbon starvation protein A [Shewanella]MBZ4679702.1 carbon starvation protein [Shewanella sp.]MCE9776045.1 carbon starvation protein A [Shewanella algae]MCE9851920.1 carbon starvation protein A [Shewanella chilikensis]MCL1155648.1 carbon starvation protein A [Shewanella chilikensis]MCL1163377.1 carbon starvation protein A [Shewanella chilikensis]
MMWFLLCVGLLIGGYFIYGAFVEKIFGINNKRQTPAYAQTDGVDYVPMSKGKVYLIQLLNIAGVGPIFGPILGALYGPAAMLWIVIGCIFAGAVHDYFSGMLSVRNGGQSVPNLAGKYLGKGAKNFMNIFAIILLLLVGVVFISAPAGLLGKLTGGSVGLFVGIIFVYYLIATIVPVDKIIGRLYPFFGALLLFMSIGLTIAIVLSSEHTLLPGFEAGDFLQNLNPDNAPLWPALFITIACGAVSGFHATQSPLMARCVENESNGRFVFYGAMIGEGIIALIWCAVALSFFDGVEGLKAGMDGNPANVVYSASTGLLGAVGGFMAVLGVIILPITSGDTAFRSARLILSEYFNMPQTEMPKRLMLAIPLFIIGAILTQVDFGVIWRYFGVANQATAVMMLWTASAYLLRHNKLHWICTIPAMFMTTVVISFLLNSSTLGAGLPMTVSTISGIVVTLLVTALVIIKTKGRNEVDEVLPEEG